MLTKLFGLGLKVACLEVMDAFSVLFHSFNKPAFLKGYLLLRLSYLFNSPFCISRRYLKHQKSLDLYQYGETPLMVFRRIFEEIPLEKGEHVIELGAGSGYTSVWLSAVLGASVTAIEQVPGFCYRLYWVVNKLGLDISVQQADYRTADLSDASLIYLYASNLGEPDIMALVERFQVLPSGVRLITVSYAIQPYCRVEDCFRLLHQMRVGFYWGKADVYIQIKT